MTMPIIVYRPKLHFVALDESGEPDGEPVDVSCDIASVELDVDQPTSAVTTFCGTFQVPGDIEESASLEVTVNAETDARWSPLIGTQVEARVYDRDDSADYRKFTTEIRVNPSLYGPTTPGEARTVDFDLPVLSPVAWSGSS